MDQSIHSTTAENQPGATVMESAAALTPSSAADIQTWLVSRLADALQVEPGEIDVRLPFINYGLESIIIFTLTGDLAGGVRGG